MLWLGIKVYLWRNEITISSYVISRNNKIELEISTNSCGAKKKKKENKKEKGVNLFQFCLSIEF